MPLVFVVVPESFRRAYEKPPNSSATGGFDLTEKGPCANAGVGANSQMAITDRGFFMFSFPSMQAARSHGLFQRTPTANDAKNPKITGVAMVANQSSRTGALNLAP